MNRTHTRFPALIAGLLCLLVLPLASDAQPKGDLVQIDMGSSDIVWHTHANAERWILTVSTPDGPVSREFKANERPSFDLASVVGEVDGSYTWELTRVPKVSASARRALTRARTEGNERAVERSLRAAGQLPEGPVTQSGTFTVVGGAIIPSDLREEPAKLGEADDLPLTSAGVGTSGSASGTTGSSSGVAFKDQVFADDVIVQGSLCVGFDCVNGESFGFDTIRLKENNTRIKFEDTSSTGSFPTVDWQLTANDSASGGANKFSIEDVDNARVPFTIEAGTPTNTLYVASEGRIGIGTATPGVTVHSVTGNTPTLRLEQNGSAGFAPQTWDVAGNEANFFIRDVTNGSLLPFRIKPGAPNDSIFIAADGAIGIGTDSPDADGIHIVRGGTEEQRVMVRLENNGSPQFEYTNTAITGAGNTWRLGPNANGDLVFNETSNIGVAEMRITPAGDVFVNGGQVHPDYVFAPEYQLMSLDDVERFVSQNRHLPGVQSATTRDEQGGINITALPLKLLEKIEELTLYTVAQHKQIGVQDEMIEELQREKSELAERLERLEAAFAER